MAVPFAYSAEFRSMIVEQMRDGRSVAGLEGHGLKASCRMLGVGVGVLSLAGTVPVRARCAPGLAHHT